MKKKLLLAVCAVTAATAMTVGLAACNTGFSAKDAENKIKGFTSTPNTVSATFKQTYELKVNSNDASMKAFEKNIADTVTIEADYTAGNVYYYGKKVAKDNSVVEQLVVKEDNTYYYLTSTTVKKALADEAAAKAKIGELMTSLTKQTTGYVNSSAFVYSSDWVNTYLMLGSNTVKGNEKNYFTYKYDKTEGDGLKVDINMQYVGYYGDTGGTFEFGTDETHKGATASIETDSNGFITSFSQTLNNHLDMRITSTPTPLDLTGTRSLTATYNGAITKKAAADITQTLNNPTVTFGDVENVTYSVYDFASTSDMKKLNSGDSLAVGRKVAVMVGAFEEGYELDTITINGVEAYKFGPCYCYDVTEDDYNVELKVVVKVKSTDPNAPTVGTIVVNPVESCTVVIADFYNNTTKDNVTTVEIGHFLAVKVTCDSGYELVSVKVNNGTEEKDITSATYGSPYCCYSISAAGTYTVTVTVKLSD